MALIKWTPMRPAGSMRSLMEEMFNDPFFGTPNSWPSSRELAIDVREEDDHYRISTALPGINEDEVDINISDNVLTIKAESKQENEREEDDGKYLIRECYSGSYYRQLSLPTNADPTQAEATTENGVLTLSIPKKPEAQPKRISVKAKNKK